MVHNLKQGSLFGGKTCFGIPEGNLFLFNKALVHQVTFLLEPRAAIGESKWSSTTTKKTVNILN